VSLTADLAGRVSLVTGGCGGIGRAIASELLRHGSAVAVLDLADAQPGSVAADLAEFETGEAWGTAASVADLAEVSEAVQNVVDRFGRLDVLVNAAGVTGDRGPAHEMDDIVWDRVLRTHLYGTMHTTRAALPGMIEARWGRIVNITSSAAWRPGPGISAYAAAKAGITGFSRAVAAEVGTAGVTVNCVAPGLTATPRLNAAWPDQTVRDQQVRRVGSVIPRMAGVEEVAAAVVGLCLPSAGYITGTTVHVNGGSYMP